MAIRVWSPSPGLEGRARLGWRCRRRSRYPNAIRRSLLGRTLVSSRSSARFTDRGAGARSRAEPRSVHRRQTNPPTSRQLRARHGRGKRVRGADRRVPKAQAPCDQPRAVTPFRRADRRRASALGERRCLALSRAGARSSLRRRGRRGSCRDLPPTRWPAVRHRACGCPHERALSC
jgi:hypothetical protein